MVAREKRGELEGWAKMIKVINRCKLPIIKQDTEM